MSKHEMICTDCARRAKYDFLRRDGGHEPRCGAHAYPLLSLGCPPEYLTVRIIPRDKR